jgi:hypothetical protein
MWDVIIALMLICPAVEMAEEWRQGRIARRLLTEMRQHVEHHHQWDVTRGQWVA